MSAPYTQTQIDNFWWGVGGSATDIRSDAFVLKKRDEVTALMSEGGAAYNADFASIFSYLYRQGIILETGVGPTGANGFRDRSTIGGVLIGAFSGGGADWNGPTRS